MKAFSDWLYATPLSHLFQTVGWFVPVVQSIHIICISLLFTSMVLLDLRLVGLVGKRHSVAHYAERTLPWLWSSLIVLLVTGLCMIITEPNRTLQNAAFYSKMTMLLIACGLTYVFQRGRNAEPDAWELRGAKSAHGRAIGLISALLWAGIIVSGRLIAYV